jgi:hypothetical protein
MPEPPKQSFAIGTKKPESMNSRDNILAQIKKNKPSELPLPDTFL